MPEPSKCQPQIPVDQQRLERLVDRMPTFPQSVQRIISICSDINFSTRELVRIIEHDPVITLKILKLVNSAYFGLSKKITSIKHAVVYVGINTIKNVAIAITAIGILPNVKQAGVDRDAFLNHSLTTATLARLIAQRFGVPESRLTDFFIAGLLHDIGVLLTAQLVQEEYREVIDKVRLDALPLHLAEQQVLGFDHAQMSALLVERWQFPEVLTDCIRNHHRLDELEQTSLLQRVVFTANQLSKQLQQGEERLSNPEPIPDSVREWLGEPLESLAESLEDLPEELEKARAFLRV